MLNTFNLTTQSSVNAGNYGTSNFQSNSTYDRMNNRFFISGTEIYVIDALTGVCTDTIPNPGNISNIEYDEIGNCLVGGNSTTGQFARIHVATHSVTSFPFSSGGSMEPGESCFDRINRRYIFRTTFGLRVVDSTGAAVTTYGNLRSPEYDATLNSIVGIFVSVPLTVIRYDLGTNTSVSLCALPGLSFPSFDGETTYDEIGHRYFTRGQSGILSIHAVTGATALAAPAGGVGLEYANLPDNGAGTNLHEANLFQTGIRVFPNPASGQFHFSGLRAGEELRITDLPGRTVFLKTVWEEEETADLDGLKEGAYFYSISGPARAAMRGVIVKKQ